MSKVKLFAFVMLAAGTNTVAFANISSNIAPVAHTWYLGAAALYLKPNLGGNGLGYSSFSNYGTDFNNVVVERNGAPNHLSNVNFKRDWGFQLNGGYEFDAERDADANWYHLQDSTHGNLPQQTLFAGSASALYAGKLNLGLKWDAVNLELGQRFDLNPMNMLRLHAGLNYSRIKTTITNFPQLTATGSPIFETHDKISYIGIGPRVGIDYLFHTPCRFGIYAKAAGSLLVGKAKQSVSGYHDLGGFNLYSTGNYNQSHHNVVIPELDANLGLQYDYLFKCGNLGFTLGYMVVTYLTSIVSQVGTGVVSSSISTSSATNFNLNGPYFGVTWTA